MTMSFDGTRTKSTSQDFLLAAIDRSIHRLMVTLGTVGIPSASSTLSSFGVFDAAIESDPW
jgi:hypothetical protein